MRDQQVQPEPVFAITQQLDDPGPDQTSNADSGSLGAPMIKIFTPHVASQGFNHRRTDRLRATPPGVEPVADIAASPVVPRDKFVANQPWAARNTLMANGFCSPRTARLGHHGAVRGSRLADHEPRSSSRVRIRSVRLCLRLFLLRLLVRISPIRETTRFGSVPGCEEHADPRSCFIVVPLSRRQPVVEHTESSVSMRCRAARLTHARHRGAPGRGGR